MADRHRRRLWPDRAQGAVSLSYDGGDLSHVETAAPCLDALCLRGTFYVPPTRVLEMPVRWAELSAAGHEIGDASLFDAAGPSGFLHDWTADMVQHDLEMSVEFYDGVFSRAHGRSLAYPVLRRKVRSEGDPISIEATQQISMLRQIVRRHYAVARGSTDGHNDPASCDVLSLRSFRASEFIAEELILLARQALDAGAWAVFAFDGVGVGDPAIDATEHARFCLWLAEHRREALIGTVHDVGCHLRKSALAVIEHERQGDVSTRVGPPR